MRQPVLSSGPPVLPPNRKGWLALRLPGGTLRLPVPLAERVEPVIRIHAVPLAPPGVIGLAELRGRPVTLLDPSLWLDGRGRLATGAADLPPGGVYGLMLAPPFGHLALAVGPSATLRPVSERDRDAPPLDRHSLEQRLDACTSEARR